MRKLVLLSSLLLCLIVVGLPLASADWTSGGSWGSGGLGGNDFGGRNSGFVESNSSLSASVDYGVEIVSGATLSWKWSVTWPPQANLTFKVFRNGIAILTSENATNGEGTEVIEDPNDSYFFSFRNDNDFDVYLWVEYNGHSDMPLNEFIAVILGLALSIIVPIMIILLLYTIFGVRMRRKVEEHFPPAAIPAATEPVQPDRQTSDLLHKGIEWLDVVTKLTGRVLFIIFTGWVFAFLVLPMLTPILLYQRAVAAAPIPEWFGQYMQILGLFLAPLSMFGFPLLFVLYWFLYYKSKHEADILKDKMEWLLGRSRGLSSPGGSRGRLRLLLILVFFPLVLLLAVCPTVSAQEDVEYGMILAVVMWIANILLLAFIVLAVYFLLIKRKPVLKVEEIPEQVGIAEMLLILVTYISRRLESMVRWSLVLFVVIYVLLAVVLIPLAATFMNVLGQIGSLVAYSVFVVLSAHIWFRIFTHSQEWKRHLLELENETEKLIE